LVFNNASKRKEERGKRKEERREEKENLKVLILKNNILKERVAPRSRRVKDNLTSVSSGNIKAKGIVDKASAVLGGLFMAH